MSLPSSEIDRPYLAPARRSALYVYGATLLTFLAASSVPTPLYRIYQERWQFSAAVLTLVFATYVFSLLASLLVVGSLSDHLGRKPIVLAGIAVQIVATLMFVAATGPTGLILARLVQGLATGVAMGALTAGLIDADQVRGQVLNSVAPLFGLALGTMGCSALVDLAPAPLQLAFVILVVLLVVQLVLVSRLPDTSVRKPGVLAALRPSIHVPPRSRRHFYLGLPINTAGWALGGFYFSLMPTVIRQATGSTYASTSGVVIATLALSGVVGTLAAAPYLARSIIIAASILLSIGTAATLFGLEAKSVWIMLVGACLAGGGFGAGFLGALRTTMSEVAVKDRAATMSALLFSSYVAFSAPALLAGTAVRFYGLGPTAMGYGTCTIALSLASLGLVVARTRKSQVQ